MYLFKTRLCLVSSQHVNVTHLINRTFDSKEQFRSAIVRPRYEVNCKKIIDLDQVFDFKIKQLEIKLDNFLLKKKG